MSSKEGPQTQRSSGSIPDPANNSSLLFSLLISGWSLLRQAQETDQGEMGDEAQPAYAFCARVDSSSVHLQFLENSVWGKSIKGLREDAEVRNCPKSISMWTVCFSLGNFLLF